MPGQVRVLVTHQYSMTQVRDSVAAGLHPAQHLWGTDALADAGFDVVYGPFGRDRRVLRSLTWRSGGRLGDLEQQAVIWRRCTAGSVVLAGEARMVRGLAALRRLGLGAPVVGIVHNAEPWMRALDVAVCISPPVRDALVGEHGRTPATTPLAPWGPDLGYERYRPAGEELVVCAGQTERDPVTLLRALEGTGLAAKVYADGRLDLPAVAGVEIVRTWRHGGGAVPYPEVLEDLRRASVVAIPLERTERLIGLTEVGDALALGKPIVMTRSPAMAVDPAAVGCGFTVEPGDVEGWRAALLRLGHDPALRAEMGARGRAFAEREHNADAFRAAIRDAVTTAAALGSRRRGAGRSQRRGGGRSRPRAG
jgi:glycosyltransferase involved in cell wall biosynthesis